MADPTGQMQSDDGIVWDGVGNTICSCDQNMMTRICCLPTGASLGHPNMIDE